MSNWVKDQKVLVEYNYGMFRESVVVSVTTYGSQDTRIRVKGLDDPFNTDGQQRNFSGYFRRKIHPFDQARIDETKAELKRRRMVKQVVAFDWDTASVDLLVIVTSMLPKAVKP